MRIHCIFLCAALAASNARPEAAPEAARRGGFEAPAGSALARNEHPRLLFTKAEIPAIRARIAKPALEGV